MPRQRVPVLERARADLAAGRPWKARDRLNGYLHQHAADQDALSLLADVHLAMGDEPAAGRALFLTERSDARAASAIEAFERRYGNSAARIQALGVRTPLETWPPRVRERLEALQERARAEGLRWVVDRPGSVQELPPVRRGEEVVLIGVFLLLLVLPWVVGGIMIVVWLLGLL